MNRALSSQLCDAGIYTEVDGERKEKETVLSAASRSNLEASVYFLCNTIQKEIFCLGFFIVYLFFQQIFLETSNFTFVSRCGFLKNP